MSSDKAIDIKPKLRGYSARGRRKALESNQTVAAAEVHHDDVDDNDANDLNIRVKDRAKEVDVVPKKGRMGSLFKEVPSTSIKGLFNKDGASGAASDLKESIKRPLSGFFRRPSSKAGRSKEEEMDRSNDSAVDDRVVSPEPVRRPSMGLSTSSSLRSRAPSSQPAGMTGQSEWESVAHAPQLSVNQLHGMLQIDAWSTKYPQLAKLDDLDISLLSRFLCHEDEVQDEDVPWTWDYLFASISTEMREEWAMDEDIEHEESPYFG